MSLLSIASPWNNEDISPKKRVSTMRKTIKKQPLPESINSSVREMNDNFQPYISREYIFDEPADEAEPESISKYKKDEESRQKRVTELLNNTYQVDADNSGQRLADFKPLSHPIIQKRTDDAETTGRSADEPMSNGYNPLQIPRIYGRSSFLVLSCPSATEIWPRFRTEFTLTYESRCFTFSSDLHT